MAALLEVEGLEAGYGKKTVLQGVSFRVDEGEVVALLGHNGAGKSTTLKTILGLLPARSGQVRFGGQVWANGDPAENVRRGIALVPQGRGVFPDLTVVENLALGAYTQADRAGIGRRMNEILELFPILAERRDQIVGTMSGGQQQMVAVGTALMQQPRLMMMDEPSIGLAPVLVQRVLETAVEINRRFGTAIVLVEQNIKTALGMARRAYVMKSGRIVLEKPAALLLAAKDSWWELY
ncbi:MAG TPA: ABC transporter ATP-binding protein [Methylomirabilota bacterium]|jgi:branched-chain amino acid transport system ATP-binding protein|nr:ABC transporter ATP-binding protein [Methylomirabilota bacterium]